MQKILIMILLLCLPIWGIASQTITLTDGSKITGDVVSMTNGTYIIQTQSMGTLTVSQDKIASIKSGGSTTSNSNAQDIQALQQSMMSNSDIMKMISALQSDPQIMATLQDPAFMSALQSGNIGALSNNPKFMKLMQNNAIQNIMQQAR